MNRLDLGLEPRPFSPLEVLVHWQRQLAAQAEGAPAAEHHFIGRMRGWDGTGQPLVGLDLEHYPGMTEAQVGRLAAACVERHAVRAVLLRHRVGRVEPGETIVLLAVAADRRGPAQRCGQELLEALKHEAPFWKKELRPDGSGTWVQGNTPL